MSKKGEKPPKSNPVLTAPSAMKNKKSHETIDSKKPNKQRNSADNKSGATTHRKESDDQKKGETDDAQRKEHTKYVLQCVKLFSENKHLGDIHEKCGKLRTEVEKLSAEELDKLLENCINTAIEQYVEVNNRRESWQRFISKLVKSVDGITITEKTIHSEPEKAVDCLVEYFEKRLVVENSKVIEVSKLVGLCPSCTKAKTDLQKEFDKLREAKDKLKTEKEHLNLKLDQQDSENKDINAKLNDRIKELINRNQKLENELKEEIARRGSDHETERLRKQVNDLTARLSKEMNEKVTQNESSLENIAIKNRPLNIADEYQFICSNQWLEAKVYLDQKHKNDSDESKQQFLRQILEVSVTEAKIAYKGAKDSIRQILTDPFLWVKDFSKALKGKPPPESPTLDAMVGDVYREQADKVTIDILCQNIKGNKTIKDSKFLKLLNEQKSKLATYLNACARLGWKMAIQRPPMEFITVKEAWKDEKKVEPAWGSEPSNPNAKLQYFIFPMLFHGDALMIKGKAVIK